MINRNNFDNGTYCFNGDIKKRKISGDDFVEAFNKLHPISARSVFLGVRQGNEHTRKTVTTLYEAWKALLDYLDVDLVCSEPAEEPHLRIVKRNKK